MWHCPKCGEEVDDAVPYWWMCGELPDGAARREFARPADQPSAFSRWLYPVDRWLGDARFRPPYRVSRRFGIGRLMCLTASFAVLCAVFSVNDARPIVYLVVLGFIVVVGLAQVFTYSGHRPRWASIIVGVVPGLGLVAVWAVRLWLFVSEGGLTLQEVLLALIVVALGAIMMALPAVTLGGFFGYLAGWVVVGILLGREVIPDADPPAESPFRPETSAPEVARADGRDAG